MGIELGQSRMPDGLRVYAVGDTHGCLDQARRLLSLIDSDLAARPVDDHRIIFLGDYMDRGPRSKDMIAFMMALRDRDERIICLRGNHDKMLLQFMDDPLNRGAIFFRNGGAATLKCFGARVDEKNLTDKTLQELPVVMSMLISGFHLHFLKTLPFSASFGDYFFCHAGVRPGVAIENQDDDDLMWIRSEFLEHRELFEKVIIHGHTPQDEVEIRNNRINVDTKCYATGILTCVVLEGSDYRFLKAG